MLHFYICAVNIENIVLFTVIVPLLDLLLGGGVWPVPRPRLPPGPTHRGGAPLTPPGKIFCTGTIGWIHPFLPIILVHFILFFRWSLCKISSAAWNWINRSVKKWYCSRFQSYKPPYVTLLIYDKELIWTSLNFTKQFRIKKLNLKG